MEELTKVSEDKKLIPVKEHNPSTALEASTMDLVPDNGILNGLNIEVEVQNILSLTSALPNLEKIK